jgi:flagellar biosynthesis/type III secretory pathway protein FliH
MHDKTAAAKLRKQMAKDRSWQRQHYKDMKKRKREANKAVRQEKAKARAERKAEKARLAAERAAKKAQPGPRMLQLMQTFADGKRAGYIEGYQDGKVGAPAKEV